MLAHTTLYLRLFSVTAALTVATSHANSPAHIETIEVTGSQQSPYTTDELQSATKLGLSIKETPQSISVITDTQIHDFGLLDISSVLGNVTGVFVQKVETDRLYYTARGFDIVNFQKDGLGLPLAYGNNDGQTDTALFERVEVVRGANGLTTGAGNPSATVNMVRKRPTEDDQARLSASVGSWSLARLEGDASAAITAAVRGRIVAAVEDKKSYLDRQERGRALIYGVLEFDLSPTTLLTVGHSSQKTETDGNLWGALPLYYTDGSPTDFDVSTSTAADWSYWHYSEHSTFVELKQELGRDWNLLATYQRERRTEDSELFYVYGEPDRQTGLGLYGWASAYDVEQWQDLVDVHAQGSLNIGGRQHEMVAGASWAMLDNSGLSQYDYSTTETGFQPGFPVLPPLAQWQGNTPRPNLVQFADGTTVRDNGAEQQDEQVSIYATTRLNITDPLKIIIGGRWDDWSSEGYSYGASREKSASNATPYLGTTYDFTSQTSAYASYTETYSAQTETGVDGARLDPLQGESYEVGVKSEMFSGKLTSTIALFKVTQNNLPIAIPKTTPEEPQRHTVADATSEGIELEAAGEAAPGLQLSAGYTWLQLDAPGSGGKLVEDYTPKQLLRAAATYQVPNLPKFKIGANVQWQDEISREQGTVGDNFDNAGELIITRQPAYTLIGLMAAYELSENFSVSLNIENLTDEKYLNSLYWEQGYYGAPRHGKVSLSWRM